MSETLLVISGAAGQSDSEKHIMPASCASITVSASILPRIIMLFHLPVSSVLCTAVIELVILEDDSPEFLI